MDWNRLIRRIAAQVLLIRGEDGAQGTGFLLSGGSTVRTVATARHVADAIKGKPATLCHHPSGNAVRIGKNGPGLRDVIVATPSSPFDVALLVLAAPEFPQPTIPLLTPSDDLRVGSDVGWLGYPGRLGETLCFFSGRISAILPDSRTYLIDGTAMPGVSGGPVFCETPSGPRLLGSISAYTYDVRKTGPTTEHALPGLAVANDVSFHNSVKVTEHDEGGSPQGKLVGSTD